MSVEKTNAARILDRANIEYELIPYTVDESDLSAVHLAEILNQPIEQIFKTLVLKGDKTGYFVCIIPGAEELNLKSASKASGNKNCEMIPMKDLQAVTGYIRGACSPLGMKKQFPIYMHESCLSFDHIYISAGKRGLQIHLSPLRLISEIKATVCFLIK